MGVAADLAAWTLAVEPTAAEREDARRQLVDVASAALAAASAPAVVATAGGGDAMRWATAAHALGVDGLHLPTITHLNTVAVVAALAAGGEERAYLAGAGVLARVAAALGPAHARAGWHTTCTAGAIGAAAGAGTALGLDAAGLAAAMALAVPAAGGTRYAFGTHGKALQVGFATAAGVRAARLVAAGATTPEIALDHWLTMVGQGLPLDLGPEVVPGGLVIKVLPCSMGLQRPIAAAAELGLDPRLVHDEVEEVVVRMPLADLELLSEGQNRNSLGYGVAIGLLDTPITTASFTEREEVRALARRVRGEADPDAHGMLAGECRVTARLVGGDLRESVVRFAPGHPERPATPAEVELKVIDCCAVSGLAITTDWVAAINGIRWSTAADVFGSAIPGAR